MHSEVTKDGIFIEQNIELQKESNFPRWQCRETDCSNEMQTTRNKKLMVALE